jgi:predicted kinase
VRAKVSVIRSLEQRDAGKADSDLATALFYGDLASRQVAERTPKLVVMHGFSGSGKTWVSGRLMAGLSAIRVRSDIERKREFGLSEAESSHSAVGGGIYSGDANRQAYARLFELARILLDAGYSVILDASFLDLKYREKALSVAEACGCPAVIVDVYASEDVMHRRLEQRQSDHAEQSEAGISVLTYQLSTADSLTSVERRLTVECDNSNDVDIPALIDRVKECNRFP